MLNKVSFRVTTPVDAAAAKLCVGDHKTRERANELFRKSGRDLLSMNQIALAVSCIYLAYEESNEHIDLANFTHVAGFQKQNQFKQELSKVQSWLRKNEKSGNPETTLKGFLVQMGSGDLLQSVLRLKSIFKEKYLLSLTAASKSTWNNNDHEREIEAVCFFAITKIRIKKKDVIEYCGSKQARFDKLLTNLELLCKEDLETISTTSNLHNNSGKKQNKTKPVQSTPQSKSSSLKEKITPSDQDLVEIKLSKLATPSSAMAKTAILESPSIRMLKRKSCNSPLKNLVEDDTENTDDLNIVKKKKTWNQTQLDNVKLEPPKVDGLGSNKMIPNEYTIEKRISEYEGWKESMMALVSKSQAGDL